MRNRQRMEMLRLPTTRNPRRRRRSPAPRRRRPERPRGSESFWPACSGVAVLAVLLVFGIPWVEEMLNTVSTDDAYVNGHVTFVAPRVAGQISRVLVDDNNRVHKGDLLAELDKEPYRVVVSEKQAAVDTAKADLQAATAAVRAIEAQAMSRRWNLQHAVEDVDNQVALLHARVAADRQEQGRTGAGAGSNSIGRGSSSPGTMCRVRCTTSGKRS
jgi:multidrug resistance efflux pump